MSSPSLQHGPHFCSPATSADSSLHVASRTSRLGQGGFFGHFMSLSSRSSRIENADIKSGYWMLGPATIFLLVDAAVYSKINTAN